VNKKYPPPPQKDEEDALEADVAAETWGNEDPPEDRLKNKKKPKNPENLDNGVKTLLAGSNKWYLLRTLQFQVNSFGDSMK
jgi:hypothetical protein